MVRAEDLHAFLKLMGENISHETCEKLVDMLDNHEEVVAHLFLKREIFNTCPELLQILTCAAAKEVVKHTPMRAGITDSRLTTNLRNTMDADLQAVIKNATGETKRIATAFTNSRRLYSNHGIHDCAMLREKIKNG